MIYVLSISIINLIAILNWKKPETFFNLNFLFVAIVYYVCRGKIKLKFPSSSSTINENNNKFKDVF